MAKQTWKEEIFAFWFIIFMMLAIEVLANLEWCKMIRKKFPI